MDNYNSFSEYYDSLLEDARYEDRCRYIFNAAEKYGHPLGKTLDLACGTGTLTLLLRKSGVDVFGVDGSVEMLSKAMQKSLAADEHILYVCQQMQELELAEMIDTCVCTLDSLNHLTDEDDVQRTFNGVGKYMNAGGLFVFDVNTVYKHREILADNAFILENEYVFCAWQNFLRGNDIVDISLDFFEYVDGVYQRSSEDFSERAYSESALREMLGKAGFEVLSVCSDLSFDPPKPDDQRIIFIAQKK